MLTLDSHPSLDLRALSVELSRPLGVLASSPALLALLSLEGAAPLASSDVVRGAVRDLLRHGGFKPTGRSKPASEYLIKASEGGRLRGINLAVDVCNVVSLHSGLPLSVVDLDGAAAPLRVGLAEEGARYVFNASGQEISIGKLLCLHDAQGPCANAVKDSERTKTHAGSERVLFVFWGTRSLPGRAHEAARWTGELLRQEDPQARVLEVATA
jgi:DNA/RNA-binding domain of Phe-tRNA-synthetase-like protein